MSRDFYLKDLKGHIVVHAFLNSPTTYQGGFFLSVSKDYGLEGKMLSVFYKKVKTKKYYRYYVCGIQVWKEPVKRPLPLIKDRENVRRQIERGISAARIHEKTFGGYKGCYEGKDVVLVATGPSLERYKPIKNAVHIGVNKAFQSHIRLDKLFVQDVTIGYDVLEDMIAYKRHCGTELFFGISECCLIPESIAARAGAKRYYTDYMYRPAFAFAYDLVSQPLGDFKSIVFAAMQFILWTRPKNVYIVGCDCTSGGGYFNNRKAKNFLDKSVAATWKKLKEFADLYYPETIIHSVNPVGLKGMFDDIYQD